VDEILNQVADELDIIITVEVWRHQTADSLPFFSCIQAPEAPKNAKTKAQPNKVNSSPQQRRGLVKTKANEKKDEDEEEEEEDEAMNEEDVDKILAARLKNLH
jgi:hypothetical protein